VANLQFPGEEPFTAPIYTFDFGDGTVVTSGNASVYHAYGAAGTYNPVLTVADSGANAATFASPVTVVGPISAGGSGAPAQAQGGQPGAKSPSAPSGAPKPNAAAAAASRSLRRALRSAWSCATRSTNACRALRSHDRQLARPAFAPARSERDRASRGNPAADRDRQSDRVRQLRREQHAAHPVRQEHGHRWNACTA